MSDEPRKQASIPPRWFVRLAWSIHRGLYRASGGRFGLRRAKADRWGMARLTTIGRRTGQERSVMIGYLEDGANLVTMAMNGWAENEPAWWLNLQAHSEATVDVADGRGMVKGRAAEGEERSRLWNQWREMNDNLDAEAALRPGETAVVVLEPSSNTDG